MCMPSVEMRTDSTGETPEVPQVPCQHWRGILRFRHPLTHKISGPGITGRGIPRGPEQLAWGLAYPEASRAGP